MLQAVPQEFLCPISLSLMEDPILMPDGHVYDRTSLSDTLKSDPKSPFTKQPMHISDAKPDPELKSRIDSFRSQHITPPKSPFPNSTINELEKFKTSSIPDPQDPEKTVIFSQIQLSESRYRRPISLIAMIDISGSMNSECRPQNGSKSLTFSRLQLVQHSLKAIISTLTSEDDITLIAFNSSAKVIISSLSVTPSNKNRIIQTIDIMEANGCTNIFDALSQGLKIASKNFTEGSSKTISLMLFTDGLPNLNPPSGIIPSLQELISGLSPHLEFNLSTFGFGYSIDSSLLTEIAKIGNGIFGYIPDSTMVGTVFVHYAAALSTTLCNATLRIRTPRFDRRIPITLYNGSSRNVIVSVPSNGASEANVILTIGEDIIPATPDNSEEFKLLLMDNYWRQKLIDLLNKALVKNVDLSQIREETMKLHGELDAIPENQRTAFITALNSDLVSDDQDHGQVLKALSDEFFKKWGEYYLSSFLLMHENEICGNFKDNSLQFYGGGPSVCFSATADRIFSSIPPPKPLYSDKGHCHQNACSMRAMMNTFSGCFNGDALVEMENMQTKLVKELRKGDVIKGGGVVRCVVCIKPENEMVDAVKVGNVILTPWHPIKVDGKWAFPAEIAEKMVVKIDRWYNLVIDGEQEKKIVRVGGVEAVTLGHGLKGPVVEHPYFGTEKVIDALKKYPGYEQGYVEVDEKKPVRDENGLVMVYF